MIDVPWHYMRPNEASRYPRRIITFDSEALIKERAAGEKHSFRCAVASFDRIDRTTLAPVKSELEAFTSTQALWEWIAGKAARKERTIVFAHNIAYDLRICDAFTVLPALGFELDFLTLDTARCVARWKGDGRTLTMTDLMSWLPCSLQKIALTLDADKRPLPRNDAPLEEWLDRCEVDVRITRKAVLEILRWLEANDMGSWRLTGAAQAHAAYRHKFMPRAGLLVHRDENALAAERRAAWTGRCELYRHGVTNGGIEEWDFENAYLNVARGLDLPVRLRGHVHRLSLAQFAIYARRYRVLADVVARTETPLLPTRHEDRIIWPVGSFATTVWDCELQHALDGGAEIELQRAWLYQKAPVLDKWACWLLEQLDERNKLTPPLMRIMLKHWARALIGRFGLRYPQLDKIAELPTAGIEYVPYVDMDSGAEGSYLQVGLDLLEKSGLVESRDSMPAIMGYVMAQARLRLANAVQAAGPENVLYVDTDALIVTGAGKRRIRAWSKTAAGVGLRRKASWASADLRAPRSLRLGDELRVAGMPKNAVPQADGRYAVTLWEGLGESLRRHHPGEVHVRQRTFNLRTPDRRRRHLPHGATEPLRLTI